MVKFRGIRSNKTDRELKAGAYYRCFGDLEIARILSTVQSLIIKNGLELEKIVAGLTKQNTIGDIDAFLRRKNMQRRVRIALKPTVKKSDTLDSMGIEPDFIIFRRTESSQECIVVELKDGHEFDTKSSDKEHENLDMFLSKNADALHHYKSSWKICGFNAENRDQIVKGFKNKIVANQAMTGKELFDLLELDCYEEVVRSRALDRKDNLDYLIESLISLDVIKKRLE